MAYKYCLSHTFCLEDPVAVAINGYRLSVRFKVTESFKRVGIAQKVDIRDMTGCHVEQENRLICATKYTVTKLSILKLIPNLL